MDEAKESTTAAAGSAAAPLSHQSAAAQPAHAQAAAISHAHAAHGASMPSHAWMEEDDEDAFLLCEQHGSSAQEERGSGGVASSQSAASRTRLPVAAVSVTVSPPLYSELPHQLNPGHRIHSLCTDTLSQEWFVDGVPNELICCVCLDVARDPPNLEACGHAICRECLTSLRSTDCPVCRQSFTHSKRASQPFAQNMVWRLRVRCLQHDKGCGWQGQLGTEMRDLKAHDAKCLFKEATCLACNKKCLLKDMPEHHRNCTHRWVKCASCQQRLLFYNFAGHQPAFQPAASMDLTDDEGEAESAAASAAPAASSASAVLAAVGVPAAAASSSSSSNTTASAAASASDLLPPLVPPCNSSEACPHGCEDPKHPGHMSVYLRSQRLAHERTCTQRPVSCTLCGPEHMLTPRQLVVHIRALFDSQRREYAQQQVVKMLVQRSALAAAPAATGAAASSSAVSSLANGSAVAAGFPSASSACSSASVRAYGQIPADRVPPPVANFGYQLRKGDVCDCLDTEKKWRVSEVIGTDSTHLLIHYVDWSSKWDEWIPKGDARIQLPRTRTVGYTGPSNKKPSQLAVPQARLP